MNWIVKKIKWRGHFRKKITKVSIPLDSGVPRILLWGREATCFFINIFANLKNLPWWWAGHTTGARNLKLGIYILPAACTSANMEFPKKGKNSTCQRDLSKPLALLTLILSWSTTFQRRRPLGWLFWEFIREAAKRACLTSFSLELEIDASIFLKFLWEGAKIPQRTFILQRRRPYTGGGMS